MELSWTENWPLVRNRPVMMMSLMNPSWRKCGRRGVQGHPQPSSFQSLLDVRSEWLCLDFKLKYFCVLLCWLKAVDWGHRCCVCSCLPLSDGPLLWHNRNRPAITALAGNEQSTEKEKESGVIFWAAWCRLSFLGESDVALVGFSLSGSCCSSSSRCIM